MAAAALSVRMTRMMPLASGETPSQRSVPNSRPTAIGSVSNAFRLNCNGGRSSFKVYCLA
jgi:hypothetical protein